MIWILYYYHYFLSSSSPSGLVAHFHWLGMLHLYHGIRKPDYMHFHCVLSTKDNCGSRTIICLFFKYFLICKYIYKSNIFVNKILFLVLYTSVYVQIKEALNNLYKKNN